MEEQTKNEYLTLRQSIRTLEEEIDEVYDEYKGSSETAKGGGRDFPKTFSLEPSTTAPKADSLLGESRQATNVPSTFVSQTSLTDTRYDTMPSNQSLLPTNSVKPKRVAFDENVRLAYSEPLHISTPMSSVGNSVPVHAFDSFLAQDKPSFHPSELHHDPIPINSSTNPFSSSPNRSTNPFTPPPSYHSKADQTSTPLVHVRETQSSSCREPKPVVMPESFDGVSMTLEDWLTNFEICCEINGWSEKQKCSFLAVKLRGAALHVYTDLPAEKRNQYASIIQSLRNRFDRSHQTELYKVQLRARVRQSGESLSELASSIRRLTNRAYPGISVEVREDLAKDQFIEALDSHHTRMHIRRRKPASLDEALTLAMEEEMLLSLEEKRKNSAAGVQALSCASTFEKQKSVPVSASDSSYHKDQLSRDDRYAELTKKVDDLIGIVESLKMKNRVSRQGREVVCWTCKKKGHVRAHCPDRQDTSSSNTTNVTSGSEN